MKNTLYLTPKVEKILEDFGITLPSSDPDALCASYSNFRIVNGLPIHAGATKYTRGVSLYTDGCASYGWDESLRGEFGWKTPVYANKATKEGYGVWCPCNDNFCLDPETIKTKSIQNYIGEDRLVELVFNAQRQNLGQYDDEDIRVTFVRVHAGYYAFYGVIERVTLKRYQNVDGYGNTLLVREYKKISDVYPLFPGDKTL